MRSERIVELINTASRSPAPSPEQRVVYELARLRVADLREPPRRYAHLGRAHD